MTTQDFLTPYGISESSLSPQVKEGLNEVLRKAGYEAIIQITKIMQAKTRELGIETIGDAETRKKREQEAVQAALAEQARLEEAAKRKQQQRVYYVIGGVLLLLLLGGVLVYRQARKRKPKNG